MTPPQTIDSISEYATPRRFKSPATATVPSPIVATLVRSPNAFTKGVRAPPTMTARRPLWFATVAMIFSS